MLSSVRPRSLSELDMNLFTTSLERTARPTHFIEIVEPGLGTICDDHFKDNSAFKPAADIKNSVPKCDMYSNFSHPRSRILELLRPEDPGHDTLEAIVRSTPRRGLTRPFDEDTRRFLHRALQPPTYVSTPNKPDSLESVPEISSHKDSSGEISLAEELMEAEEDERSGGIRRELIREFRRRGGGIREAIERDKMGKLALSVEDDEGEADSGLSAAARRIDALLAESRNLHEELAGIQEDLQAESARACRCVAIAKALVDETQALRFLDDVVALLKGDVSAAVRVKAWPFVIGKRHPDRNYVI